MICIILWVILLVALLIVKIADSKRKKKRYRRMRVISKAVVLCSFPSALTLTLLTILSHIYQKNNALEEIYTAEKICVWESELYNERRDPASLPKVLSRGDIQYPSEVSQSPGISQSTKVPQSEPTEMPMAAYDYSILMIFGKYEFGEHITQTDLNNMQSMYEEYWEKGKCWDMLGEINDNSEKIEKIDERIEKFDKINKNVLTAADYFQNAEDRLCRYGGRKEDIGFLEQSAISAENAVEIENVEISGGYEALFGYIRSAAVRFSCAFASECEQYDSGKSEDVKYRMGKVMYKPAINLNKINLSEKYYSLCSAYVVLKDAFDYSTPDSTYAVEVAYYYMLVCNDIVNAMEPKQAQQMENRVKLAYYQLCERVNEKSEPAYNDFINRAEKIIEDLKDKG